MCGKPTLNGEPGYSWDGKGSSTYPVNPPPVDEGEELLYDEPGRCGGLDSHSHHFRLVKGKYGGYALPVRHGGGDERVELGVAMRSRRGEDMALSAFAPLDSNTRYWLLHTLHHLHRASESVATRDCNYKWQRAAAEKRIKTRKIRGRSDVKVWIEPRPLNGHAPELPGQEQANA